MSLQASDEGAAGLGRPLRQAFAEAELCGDADRLNELLADDFLSEPPMTVAHTAVTAAMGGISSWTQIAVICVARRGWEGSW